MWRTRIWARAPYCVVEMHADVGACGVPDYAVISSPAIVQGEADFHRPGIDEAIQALPEGYD